MDQPQLRNIEAGAWAADFVGIIKVRLTLSALELFDCGRTLNVVLGFRSLRAAIAL